MTSTTDSVRKPNCVADSLGLGRLGDGAAGTDPELLRRLYRHCRNEDNQRELFEKDSTFVGKWINLSSPAATEIISTFVALDDESTLKKARMMAKTNLGRAVGWNDTLGINSVPIRCRIKIHGKKWAMRFESGTPAMKGQELVNEQLPPIPTEQEAELPLGTEQGGTAGADDTPTAASESSVAASDCPATDALRSAGMPS